MSKIEPQRDNKALLLRLSKIEGQIRGIKKMIEENKPCDEVIIQISSASSSLKSTAKTMLDHHIDTCVLTGILEGDREEAIENLKNVIDKFSKVK